MSSRIEIVSEITIDSFWSSKYKQTVWRVSVYFSDGYTPYRKFTNTLKEAVEVASKYWKAVEKAIRDTKS